MIGNEGFLDADEVAQSLGVTRSELLRKVRLGQIGCYRFGRLVFRFTPEQVTAYQERALIARGVGIPQRRRESTPLKVSKKTAARLGRLRQ